MDNHEILTQHPDPLLFFYSPLYYQIFSFARKKKYYIFIKLFSSQIYNMKNQCLHTTGILLGAYVTSFYPKYHKLFPTAAKQIVALRKFEKF
jgi:hypothetical protein